MSKDVGGLVFDDALEDPITASLELSWDYERPVSSNFALQQRKKSSGANLANREVVDWIDAFGVIEFLVWGYGAD